jgi:hypothetical protein
MFGKKIGLIVICAALTTFAMGRVESLAAHRGFAGSTAWAQSWDDSADDAASTQSPTLPNVAGTYSGSIEDHRFGNGTISATISQGGTSGGVLSGSWSTDVGGGITSSLKGKVLANSSVTLRLKVRGACHLVAHGTFENGDEIVGVYHASGCGGADHGHFDMTD